MSKLEIEVVKPNLHLIHEGILFGLELSDVENVSKYIDKIIKKNIGVLKVQEGQVELMKSGGKQKSSSIYKEPLSQYLNYFHSGKGVTSKEADLFDLGYLIQASNVENIGDISGWKKLEEDLSDPEEHFNKVEKKCPVWIFNREKTLEKMIDRYQELDSKIPDNHAFLYITRGYLGNKHLASSVKAVGIIRLEQLKDKDDTKIEKTKSELIETLKEVDGPCLSFDAGNIMSQERTLFGDAEDLIQGYGDILANKDWRERYLLLDP